jgi:hypothetical protein
MPCLRNYDNRISAASPSFVSTEGVRTLARLFF